LPTPLATVDTAVGSANELQDGTSDDWHLDGRDSALLTDAFRSPIPFEPVAEKALTGIAPLLSPQSRLTLAQSLEKHRTLAAGRLLAGELGLAVATRSLPVPLSATADAPLDDSELPIAKLYDMPADDETTTDDPLVATDLALDVALVSVSISGGEQSDGVVQLTGPTMTGPSITGALLSSTYKQLQPASSRGDDLFAR